MKLIFSKKAGLQMSINAIVVLVMAMVVLGLGLGFIRGMFNSADDKFSGAIDAADLTTKPTADNPISFEKQTVNVKRNSQGSFIVAHYSDDGYTTAFLTTDNVACDASFTGSNCFSSPAITIPAGEAKGFTVLINKACTATSGNYICSLTVDGNSKQFFLKID